MQQLWKARWLNDQELTLSERGRVHIRRRLMLAPDGLPLPLPFKVVVGPIASGAAVVEDPTIFERLVATQGMRKVVGLEIESSSILELAYLRKLPFAVVMKGVMDYADVLKSDNMKPFAAMASAECLIAFLRQNLPAVSSDEDAIRTAEVERLVSDAATTSQRLLERWKRRHKFNAHQLVRLKLLKRPAEKTQSRDQVEMPLEEVAAEIARSRHVVISGRPGAGKTLTLLQLADLMHERMSARMPIVVSVAAWLSSGNDFREYLAREVFSDDQRDAQPHLLFESGRVALLLNGWNEAEEDLQLCANEALRDFNLHYPDVPIVITTRDTKFKPAALDAVTLEVAHLSVEQKVTIVDAANIPNREALLAQIKGSSAVALVTDTPLFLAAAIQLARKGRSVPGTRAQLLDAFVDEAERTDNHLDVLMSGPCRGFHRRYLECVADTMTSRGSTVLTADECHRALAGFAHDLVRNGHLSSSPSGADIADSLVRHHILVSVPGARPGYEFLHQQFQELFAARSLERQTLTLVDSPDLSAIVALQKNVLDREHWRVSVELTIELLTSSANFICATQLVRWCMALDLIVAAELCDIAGEQVWSALRDEFAATLRKLYSVGGEHRQCALSAMLATGAADFADLIWAELHGDEQPFYELITLCRSYLPFRASSLGPRWETRVAEWLERKQEAFLLEVLPGEAELAFAEERAKSAAGVAVRKAAFALLGEQGQFDRIVGALSSTDICDWIPEVVAAHWRRLPRELQERFTADAERRFYAVDDVKTRRAIVEVLRAANDERWIAFAKKEMEDALPQLGVAPRSLIPGDVPLPVANIAYYADRLQDVDSDWVVAWSASKLGRHLWQKPFSSFLKWFSHEMLRERVEAVTESAELDLLSCSVEVIAECGPTAVDSLVQLYLRTRNERLRSTLRDVPIATLTPSIARIDGLFSCLEDRETLVELFFSNQMSDPRLDDRLDRSLRNEIRGLAHRVAITLPDGPAEAQATREQLSVLLGYLRHDDDLAIVTGWADREQRRWENYHSKAAKERRRLPPYGTNSWWWFRSAIAHFQSSGAEQLLVRWLESPYLLGDGALGLVELSSRDGALPPLPPVLTHWSASPIEAVKVPKQKRTGADSRVADRATLIWRALQNVHSHSDDETRRARANAIVALAKLNDERAVDLMLDVDSPLSDWQVIDGSLVMAQRGALLPGKELGRRLESFLEANTARERSEDVNSWSGVVRGLSVLVGSDDPTVAVDRIRSLLAGEPPVHRFRDLCSLLAASSDPAAAGALLDVSRGMPYSDARYQEILLAMGRSTNAGCHERILDVISDQSTRSRDLNEILRRVSIELATASLAFRSTLLVLFERANGEVAMRLGEILAEVGDDQAANALLRYPDPELVERSLRRLVQVMTETKVPLPNHPGSYLLRPREAASLRRQLAAQLVSRDAKRCGVASRLLVQIRVRRVTAGSLPANEPLHPDVSLLSCLDTHWELCCTARAKEPGRNNLTTGREC